MKTPIGLERGLQRLRRIPRTRGASPPTSPQRLHRINDALRAHCSAAPYGKCLGVAPFKPEEFDRLRDLILLRHTTAHHGGLIRQIDVPRFQFYRVVAGRTVNPPRGFVLETCAYLYRVGRDFEESVRNQIFSSVIPALGGDWATERPSELIQLIELFNYFDKLVESNVSLVMLDPAGYRAGLAKEAARVQEQLLNECVEDLARAYRSTERDV